METPQEPTNNYRSQYDSRYRSGYQSYYQSDQGLGFEEVHLSDYIFVLKRYKWTVILIFLSIVAAVAAYSYTATPVFKATTQIFVEPPSFSVAGMDDGKYRSATDKKHYLETQLQLLKSLDIIEDVLDEAEKRDFVSKIQDQQFEQGSIANPEQNEPVTNDNPLAGIVQKFQEFINKNTGSSTDHDGPTKYSPGQYLSNLRIAPIKESGLVNISIFDLSPEKAAALANTHAKIFIKKNRETLTAQGEKNLAWLADQIEEQKGKLEVSQRALHEYQKSQKIVSLDKSQDINTQKLMQLSSALIQATATREVKETAYNQLRNISVKNKGLYSFPAIAQDRQILDLRARYMALQEQRSSMVGEFGPNHSKMVELRKKINYVEQQLKNEIGRVKGFLKKELDQAVAMENAARAALDQHKNTTLSLQEKEIEYDILKREADSNQMVYDSLVSRSKQFDLVSAFKSDNIYIVKQADIPIKPAKPKKAQNILLGAIAALFLGCGLAFFRDYMDKSVKTPTDVRRYLDLPVIGVLPFDKSVAKSTGPTLPAESNDTALVNSYKYPFLRVLDWLPSESGERPETGGSILLMESAKMSEGKTTISGNMALHFGKSGYRVLVADCDFQRPAAHKLFGEQNNDGFTDAMKEIMALDINSGDLNNVSISDLYSLIAFRKTSGRLKVVNGDQTIISVFQNGRLIDIISENTPYPSRIGSMLVQEGFLTKSQYSAVLARNMRTGQPFGYIVVNSGHVTRNQLQGLIKLQCEENLQKLFSWKRGTFEFDHGDINSHDTEKIHFDEDYSELVAKLSRASGSRQLEKIILSKVRETGRKNVDLICTGPIEDTYGDPVNNRLLGKLLDLLKQRYDIIIMDGPPVLDAADSVILARIANHVIFVIKAGYQTYPALQEAVARLMDKEDNAIISGVVLNMVKNLDLS